MKSLWEGRRRKHALQLYGDDEEWNEFIRKVARRSSILLSDSLRKKSVNWRTTKDDFVEFITQRDTLRKSGNGSWVRGLRKSAENEKPGDRTDGGSKAEQVDSMDLVVRERRPAMLLFSSLMKRLGVRRDRERKRDVTLKEEELEENGWASVDGKCVSEDISERT